MPSTRRRSRVQQRTTSSSRHSQPSQHSQPPQSANIQIPRTTFVSPDDGACIAYYYMVKQRAIKQRNKPTIVLLNGLGCSLEMWSRSWLNRLAKHHDVLAIDHRGVGQSRMRQRRPVRQRQAPPVQQPPVQQPLAIEDITLSKMASDVHHLLNHLQLTSVVLVGFSFGFFIAQTFVKQYNEHDGKHRVRGLINYDSSPAPINTANHQLGFSDAAGILSMMKLAQTDNRTRTAFDKAFRPVLWGKKGAPHPKYVRMWESSLRTLHKDHIIAQFLCCATFEEVDALRQYAFPVLSCMANDGAFSAENHHRSIAKCIRESCPENRKGLHPAPVFFTSGHLISHFCEVQLANAITSFVNNETLTL